MNARAQLTVSFLFAQDPSARDGGTTIRVFLLRLTILETQLSDTPRGRQDTDSRQIFLI